MRFIIFAMCFLFLLSGCKDREENKKKWDIIMSNSYSAKPYGNIDDNVLYIAEIDKHEYLILSYQMNRGLAFVHKADCKFCKK
jgi:uncharacterized lipoprotein YehR (DUF1307 family)